MSTTTYKTMVAVLICAACGVVGSIAATGGGKSTSLHGFLPVYAMYLIVAAGVGFLHSSLAWMSGSIIMPVHWIVVVTCGATPSTSTVGVGHLYTILLSVPLALASHSGALASRACYRQT